MKKTTKVPVVSPEMAFVGKYIDDVWAIREGSIVPPKDVANLSNAVYERAAQGFDRLLEDARTVMAAASTDLVRFAGWHFANRDWDTWSNVYLTVSGRPGKSRCMVGLYIGMGEREEFRLIGYLRLRPGTADSHKAFRDKCSRKLLGVHVPGDQKERYPAEWNEPLRHLARRTSFRAYKSADAGSAAQAALAPAVPPVSTLVAEEHITWLRVNAQLIHPSTAATSTTSGEKQWRSRSTAAASRRARA